MSYAHDKCLQRHTPGQGLRMRQVILMSPTLQNCLVQPDLDEQHINTTTTWSTIDPVIGGDFFMDGDLVVEPGATLTIETGVTIHFSARSRVIIKPNARLILHGTLTGLGCSGNTWKGVEVWGSEAGSSQYGINGVVAQGSLTCAPGSVIENAETGVQLYGPTEAEAGGRLACDGNTIRNCQTGVKFAAYDNFWPFAIPPSQQGQPRNYAATFHKVNFVTDRDYPHRDRFYAFVHMEEVNGITFEACSFTSDQALTFKPGGPNPDPEDEAKWGYGIFADNAGFQVISECTVSVPNNTPCPSYTYSTFSGLGYGIHAQAAMMMEAYPIQVRQARFDRCVVGIRDMGVGSATLLHNEFTMGELPTGSTLPVQSGIVFEGSVSGFTCQENTFFDPTGPAALTTRGIFCDHTGDMSKEIRRNTFIGLVLGNQAEGSNGNDEEEIRGLNYLCNVNQQVSGQDFHVAELSHIRSKQGLPILQSHNAAGNRFSYTGTDFRNDGDGSIEYYYDPSAVNQTPLTIGGLVTPLFAFPNDCSVEYCIPPCLEPGDGNQFRNTYYTEKANYLS
ncbi:MAG TPA: hypothetical protein P5563_08640, partial [Saprospiraceae bacterium]|nr:hypothetical protein [Saprospiraceae bacterium]